MPPDRLTKLTQFLADVTTRPVHIQRIWPLAGGASRETWAMDVIVGEQPMALVLRLDTASVLTSEAISRPDEFHLLQLAYQNGVLCPRPEWLCPDPAILGFPFFIMERVEGESIGPKVVRRPDLAQARQQLPQQMAEQLARIQAIDPTAINLPRPPAGTSPAQYTINYLRRTLAELQIFSPSLTFGLRWLEQKQPPAGLLCLVHGDFRIGNLLVNPAGLAAVIDWEFAHLGDPLEDLAWPMVRDWRFGNDQLRLGGIAPAGPYLAAYKKLTGRAIDPFAITYWEIMGNMKWAVTCLVQAHRHLSGQEPSVEFASLGRRSAEMELELLNLIASL